MMGQAGVKFRIDHHVIWSFLSGLLLFFSFPKFGVGFMAWVALAPLFYALKDANPAKGFSLGFITGIISHIGILYWITYVVVYYGNLPYYAGITVMLLLATYLSLYTAVFASGVIFFREHGIPAVFSSPFLWTSLEYAKSHLFTGFPWENLAYSQYLYTHVVQIADITGIYGVTFLIVMVNAIVSDIIMMKGETKKIARRIMVGGVIMTLICVYGFWKIHYTTKYLKGADVIEVSVIQGNIDQSVKWDPHYQSETINIYRNLSMTKAISGSELIVWPETATPFFFQDGNDLHRRVVDVARDGGNWLLFGSPSYLKNKNGVSLLNSAFILSPDGDVRGKYDKVHLVPYGEYIPLKQWFPFIRKLVTGVGDFISGKGYYPLDMNHHKIGVLICYEGIFPEAARSYKKAGADLLVNITNDAWFGMTSAPHQHLSMTTLRAVETRLSIVRAANTGVSAFIDPIGKITNRTNLFEEAVLKESVKISNDKTFYMLYGDVFVYICTLSVFICILISIRRKKK